MLWLLLLLLLPVLLPSPVEFEFRATKSSIFSSKSALLSADVPLTMVRPSCVMSRRYSVMILSSLTLNFFIIWGSVNRLWTTLRGILNLEAMAAWLTMAVEWGLWR